MKNKQDSKDNTLKPLKMENNKNLFVIPTNNPSRVYGILGGYRLGLTSNDPFYTENFGGGTQNQNICVTSDEEIKAGDWFWKPDCNMVFKAEYTPHKGCKKVVLTTDQELIQDGVQPIPDEFLVWFVEKVNDSGKPIDIVEIEKIGLVSDNGRVLYGIKYKIIIPQEAVRPYSAEQYDSEMPSVSKEEPIDWSELENSGLDKPFKLIEEPKQESFKEKLEKLVSEWRTRQHRYQIMAKEAMNEESDRKFVYKAMATRDCLKELLKLIEDEK